MYLIHTTVINIVFFSLVQKPFFSLLFISSAYVFIVFVSLSMSILAVVCIEYPIADQLALHETQLSGGKEAHMKYKEIQGDIMMS